MSGAPGRALRDYGRFYEQLTLERLGELDTLLAERVRFIDPFNDVIGIPAVRGVFEHMFRQCPDARFQVLHASEDDGTGYLHWRFQCKGAVIEGLSQVVFDRDGRVLRHTDYWDPAAQLYERVPLLGTLMRFIRRRLAAPSAARPAGSGPGESARPEPWRRA